MKHLITLLLAWVSMLCIGQNNTPVVEVTNITKDDISQTLTIDYALLDADGDSCEVWLKSSTDNGVFFETIPSANISGDVGTSIPPSSSLSLVWDYSDSSVAIESIKLRLFASDNQAIDIQDMVNQVNQVELLATLDDLVGERHYSTAPSNLAATRTYISNAFAAAGLQTENQNFQFAATTMQNVLGRKPGAKEEAATIIIDGHFDGVPGSPAADDNASAVAGMLETLRILSQYNFEHSIRFIGFDAEELGLIGSQLYVANGIKPFEIIEGVLNLEMIGYYSDQANTQQLPAGFSTLFPTAAQEVANDQFKGNFLFVCGNTTSNPLITAFTSASATYVPDLRLISASVPGTGTIAPDLRRSDHAPFWDGGFQALMLTDTSNFRNLNYHTPNDVIETLDLEFMEKVVKATLATAAELAIPISADFEEIDLSTLSILEHHHGEELAMFISPNPSHGILSLHIKEAKTSFKSRIEIYDLSGKRVYREVVNVDSGSSSHSFDLQTLEAGTYILNLTAENSSKSLHFIIGD